MKKILLYNNEILLLYSYLFTDCEITKAAVDKWIERKVCVKTYVNNHPYLAYSSIPKPSRKKLPSEDSFIALIKSDTSNEITERYYKQLEKAYTSGFVKYRDIYKEYGLQYDEVTKYAQHHAVWAKILELHKEHKKPKLRNIWEAYNRLYPKRYVYGRMNECIRQCKREGIEGLLIKKYKGRPVKYSEVYDKWIIDALSSGKGYTQTEIHRMVCELGTERGMELPSLTHVKRKCRFFEPFVSATRNGSDRDTSSILPFAKMERASKPNYQWQVDGWRLPFYMEGYRTLTLFWVLDAFSGRIIGYEIAASENTETILKGLEDAVNTTGCLPFEIVSDNHSFNKTSEADYFKEELEKIAASKWTVSSNPRHKSFVERSFKTFGERFCKREQGYIGEGIRTRNKHGRTTQELMDQYTKAGNWLTEDQIKLIAIKCVDQYNNAIGTDGLSRIERYQAHADTDIFTVDVVTKLRLFTRAGEYKVTRGQINIVREGIQYEFQLKASLQNIWNGKKVRIRYADFDEIYMFDSKTDEFISTVKRKEVIHGALKDKTEEDKEKLFRHKGRLKGIITDRKNMLKQVSTAAFELDPEAAYAMNTKLTPKDIVEDIKSRGLVAEAERHGINLEYVPKMPSTPEVRTYFPDTDKEDLKRRESPVLAKEHEIRNFDINNYEFEE